jgi:TolB-like protein
MAEEAGLERSAATMQPGDLAAGGFWARVREHKIIQWGVGYLGAALALAHGQELVGHAFHWPDSVARMFMVVLIAGLPVAITLAWYHGHRGLTRISAGELTIISLLVLIGAVLFTVSLRPAEHATQAERQEHPAGTAAGNPAAAAALLPAEASRPSPAAAVTPLRNSIAVLPFENLSPNRDDEYFAAAIHEQVLNQLAKISDLTPMARTAVLRYAAGNVPIPEIARELKVESVMQGTVRYADDQVRITTQLIDAATEALLWSETYTRPFENIFAIETDIATQIAAALEAELAPREARSIGRQPTESAEAYALYLRALASFTESAGGLGASPAETAEFHRHLDRAIELDPAFALAYATKARDYAYSIGRSVPRSAGLSP